MTVISGNNLVANGYGRELSSVANEFVNTVFYGSLLREFRNAQRPTVLDGGRSNQIFMRMFDTEITKRIGGSGIGGSGSSDLADAIVKQLGGNVAGKGELFRDDFDTVDIHGIRTSHG